MLLKNVAAQGIYLFAYDTVNNIAKTGDASNITGHYSLDGAAWTSFATTNPTEIGGGVYWQPLLQAGTNGNACAYCWTSTTTGIQIDPVLVLTTGVSLPTAAPAASGGLPTVGTGSGQINPMSGGVDVQTWLTHAVTAATSGVPDVNVKNYSNQAATEPAALPLPVLPRAVERPSFLGRPARP